MQWPYESYELVPRFKDQYLAKKTVWNELGLTFGRCEDEAKAILAQNVVTNPNQEQLFKSMDDIKQEHKAIICIYKADRQKYGKLFKRMENYMLFPKLSPIRAVY